MNQPLYSPCIVTENLLVANLEEVITANVQFPAAVIFPNGSCCLGKAEWGYWICEEKISI